MKTMKSLIASTAALPFLLTSCIVSPDWQTGNGVSVTEVRDLPVFSRVELEAPVQVTIKTGREYAAYVTGDGNLVDYFETEASGGVLTISQAYAVDPVVEPHITIVVPDLRSVVHNGMGRVSIEEDGDFPDLSLTLNGGGEIHFSGTASRLRAELNGTGGIYAEGYAAFLEAVLRGQGEVSAENLLTADAEVELSGSGNVYLDLDYGASLDLALSGSGRVEWWGQPASLEYDLSGTGKVIEHRGLPKKTANAKVAAKMASGPAQAKARTATAADKPYEMVNGK